MALLKRRDPNVAKLAQHRDVEKLARACMHHRDAVSKQAIAALGALGNPDAGATLVSLLSNISGARRRRWILQAVNSLPETALSNFSTELLLAKCSEITLELREVLHQNIRPKVDVFAKEEAMRVVLETGHSDEAADCLLGLTLQTSGLVTPEEERLKAKTLEYFQELRAIKRVLLILGRRTPSLLANELLACRYDRYTQGIIIEVAGLVGDPSFVPLLIEIATKQFSSPWDHYDLRCAACYVLRRMDIAAPPEAYLRLADSSWATTQSICSWIAVKPDVQLTLRLMGDSNQCIREGAARVAGLSQMKQAVPRLLEMLNEDECCMVASTSIVEIGDTGIVPSLLAMLDPNAPSRTHAAAYVLGTWKCEAAVHCLLDVLAAWLQRGTTHIAGDFFAWLGWCGDQRYLDLAEAYLGGTRTPLALPRTSGREHDFYEGLIRGLGMWPDDRALPILRRILRAYEDRGSSISPGWELIAMARAAIEKHSGTASL